MGIAVAPLGSPDEIDAILAIDRESFNNPWTREMYLEELRSPERSHILLARDGAGGIIGYCAFWRVLDEMHINGLAVTPGSRRAGVASTLLRHALDDARRSGVVRAVLEVRRSNEAARRLYEQFGFVISAVRSAYYSHPVEDALILERAVGRATGP